MLFCQHFWQTAPSKVDINFFSTPPKNNPDAKITGYKPKNNWALFQHYSVGFFSMMPINILYYVWAFILQTYFWSANGRNTTCRDSSNNFEKANTPKHISIENKCIFESLSDFILIFYTCTTRLECTYIHSMSIHPTLYKLLKCNRMNS